MQTQTSQDGALRRLRPRQFRLESLLVFWVLAILLPALAILGLLNFSVQQQRETVQADLADQLLDAYDKLNKACEPGAWFVSQVEMAETIAGLPSRNSKLLPAANIGESAAPHLNRLFSRIRNHDLLLLMAAGGDLKNLAVFTDPVRAPDFPRPGLRAAREILGELLNQHGDQQQSTGKKDSRKILRSFITSTFGTYLDPVDAEEDFTRGFSEKSGINRLRTARRLVKMHMAKSFSSTSPFSGNRQFPRPQFRPRPKRPCLFGAQRRMVLKPARPFPFIHTTADNQLKLVAPINISLLTSGIFKQKDQITDLLNRGIMAHRPALYPHFEISATPDRRNHHEKTVEPGLSSFFFFV